MASRNFSVKPDKLFVTVAAFLTAVAMMLSGGSRKVMAGECKTAKGHFISQAFVRPPTCTSPLGLCLSGRAIGGLHGDFVATVTSLTPSLDVAVTTVFFFTADLLLHTKDGDLVIKEAGAFNFDPTGDGDLGDVATIIGGTGRWAGATGRLRIAGTIPLVVGGEERSDVDFDGEVCTP